MVNLLLGAAKFSIVSPLSSRGSTCNNSRRERVKTHSMLRKIWDALVESYGVLFNIQSILDRPEHDYSERLPTPTICMYGDSHTA